jgi:hypothetical protein
VILLLVSRLGKNNPGCGMGYSMVNQQPRIIPQAELLEVANVEFSNSSISSNLELRTSNFEQRQRSSARPLFET